MLRQPPTFYDMTLVDNIGECLLIWKYRQIYRNIDRQIEIKIDGQKYRQIDRYKDRQTNKKVDG